MFIAQARKGSWAETTVRYSFALAISMCRARRESGAQVHLLGSHNCARVTHFISALEILVYYIDRGPRLKSVCLGLGTTLYSMPVKLKKSMVQYLYYLILFLVLIFDMCS